ncbi:monocarboxylate transporter 12-B-like isoform X2 [Agrilus planipennis]|uniref:Monocarboxylate transporter 12-B-like isoform X2 n=1 Tax=Agrilus planipennis TaxID=224129 RepID=A0A1W4X2U7_AGRPL|nr:monocarboxylate transporter 12-B-like isoform X2 [Agrilus planipennis]
MSSVKQKMLPPDGGWGWWVVIGGAIVNMANLSLSSQYGLIYGQNMEEMGYRTVGVGFVMNVNTMLLNISGLIIGPFLKIYPKRGIAVLGVLFSSAGMIVSSMARVGRGILVPTIFVTITDYFDKKKSYAIGWSLVGTSIGQLLMPLLVEHLLREFGYKGTVLILGAVCLNALPGTLFFHPVAWHLKEDCDKSEGSLLLLGRNSTVKYSKYDCSSEEESQRSDQTNLGAQEISKWRKFVNHFDLTLLKDLKFVHIIFGTSVTNTCNLTFGMLLPFTLMNDKGLLISDVALCMSLQSAADIVGRITIPLLAKGVQIRVSFLLGMILIAFTRSAFIEQSNYKIIIGVIMLSGYLRAATVLNQNLILVEHLGDQSRLPSAIGLSMLFKGISVLLLGEVFGFARDYFQSYRLCIHIQSLVLITISISWIIELLIARYQLNIERNTDDNDK